MKKFKKILIISTLPILAFVLSGCGSPSQTPASTTTTPNVTSQTQQPEQQPSNADKKEAGLPPLPADSKKAIDSEITSINKDLGDTDSSTNSADLSNSNLGL